MKLIPALLLVLQSICVNAQILYTDHHVHLQDSATVQLGFRLAKATGQTPSAMDSLVLDADTIIERLNRAKFQTAWIISNAYWFGSPFTPVDNEYAAVKKQNDWIAEQAARYPDRLKAFMSVNPLKPYALEEIERCAASKNFVGLKLHFANSKVDLFDTAQLAQLQKVFALANKNHLVMLIHFRNGLKWNGHANMQILLQQLMPVVKDTKVVLAHLCGWGGYDKQTDAALALAAAYMHHHNNLYVEISAVLPLGKDNHKVNGRNNWNALTALKNRISQISKTHILFGTDWPMTDIDPYISLLKKTLGASFVQQLLGNTVDGY